MPEDLVKLFGLNNLSIEADLRRLENELKIDLGHIESTGDKDETYYPQFSEQTRQEAASMARHYEMFYCLETSIRELIRDRLSEEFGATWWDQHVPKSVVDNAEANKKKEISSGVTLRSADPLAYTNFGELGEIIKVNWQVFEDTLTDIRAVEVVLARLNTMRGPIAHCCPLAEDEVQRLRLSVKDWFRLME